MKALFDPGRSTGAFFSDCRTWRYSLWRTWNPGLPVVAFVGLNPSTADETQDDPTIRRCISFAKSWGFGSYVMLNLFAYRSTDPRGLKACLDPVGPGNDEAIAAAIKRCNSIVVAWGAHSHPLIKGRASYVSSLIPEPLCLGVTKSGNPKHPLYVHGGTVAVPWAK